MRTIKETFMPEKKEKIQKSDLLLHVSKKTVFLSVFNRAPKITHEYSKAKEKNTSHM